MIQSRSAAPARLLFVHPKKPVREAMAARLEAAGYEVVCVEHALDGLAAFQRAPIDLMLCEINLPGRSGIELTRIVREHAHFADVPIMLIAGRSNRAAMLEGFRAGADDVIAKPFDTDVLMAGIARRIERAEAVDALKQDNAALDARVIRRAIELGELRETLLALRAGQPAMPAPTL